jgi:ABC-type transport system substrate-binding protein
MTRHTMDRRTLLRRALTLSALSAAGALLNACGGTGSTPLPTASPRAGTTGVPAANAASPTVGTSATTASGTITYAQSLQNKNLDPGNPLDYPCSYDGLYAIYSRLYTFDADMHLQPDLATSYETSQDGLSWTFKLKQGVKFHDGTPFDATAVKVNLERLADPQPTTPRPNGGTWRQYLQTVTVADPYTVTITTKKPVGALLNYLAHGSGGMISPTALKQYGDNIGLHPVGSGPYQVKEFVPSQSLTLQRYEGYHATKPRIQTLIMKAVLEPAARVAALQTGEADVIYDVPPLDAQRLASNGNISVIQRHSLRGYYIGLDLLRPQFQDKAVRQALNYAVDKASIIKALFFGFATKMDSPFAPDLFTYTSVMSYDYNPTKARDLLTSAGWSPGPDGIFHKGDLKLAGNLLIAEGEYPQDIQVGQAIQSQLKQFGMDLQLKKVEASVRISNYLQSPNVTSANAQYDTYFWAYNPSNGDPGSVMSLFDWRTNTLDKPVSNWDMVFYNNAQVNDLITKGETTTDQEARKQIYGDIQRIVMDDAPYIYLYVPDGIIATRKNVTGVKLMPVVFTRFDEAGKS